VDTSETYIRMCEKAKSIQEKRGNKNTWWKDGDYVYCMMYGERNAPENRIDVFLEYAFQDDHYDDMEFIWLPRQDQLQEMVKREDYSSDITDGALMLMGLCFLWCKDNWNLTHQFTSMEQLWLAFVMKEKYSKVWNGEDWIKQG